MKNLFPLLVALSGCAGERGSGTFSLEGHSDRIAVGTSAGVRIRNDNYYSHGALSGKTINSKHDEHPLTDLKFELDRPDLASVHVDPAFHHDTTLIVTAKRAGRVKLTVHGTLRGVRHQHSLEIEAVLPASTRYVIGKHVVRPGEEITLLRGVEYLASVQVFDALGNRLNATPAPKDYEQAHLGGEPSWTSEGDIPLAGAGWKWSATHRVGFVWSDRAGTIQLPALQGTGAGHVRFIDDVILEVERRADRQHVSLMVASRDGSFRQRVGMNVVSTRPAECRLFNSTSGLIRQRESEPCEAEITVSSTPDTIYPTIWTGPFGAEAGDDPPALDDAPITVVRKR